MAEMVKMADADDGGAKQQVRITEEQARSSKATGRKAKAGKVKSLYTNYYYAPCSTLSPSRIDDAVLAEGAMDAAAEGGDAEGAATAAGPAEGQMVRQKARRRSSGGSSASPFSPSEEVGFASLQEVSCSCLKFSLDSFINPALTVLVSHTSSRGGIVKSLLRKIERTAKQLLPQNERTEKKPGNCSGSNSIRRAKPHGCKQRPPLGMQTLH